MKTYLKVLFAVSIFVGLFLVLSSLAYGAPTSTAVPTLIFYDEIRPDNALCSNGQILKKTGANDWDCAADDTTAGGGSGSVSTSTAITTTHFPYWVTQNGGLAGTSTLQYNTSTNIFSIFSTASSTALQTPSGTITTFNFTNASGTALTVSGALQSAGTLFITGQATLVNVSSTNFTASGNIQGSRIDITNASTSNLTISNVTSTLVLASSNGFLSVYAGSACGGSDQVVSISATGTVACSAQGAGGSGSVSTGTAITDLTFPFWMGVDGKLAGSSTVFYTTSTLLFEVRGLASTTQIQSPSGTITTFAFTNASGTHQTLSGNLIAARSNITDASSTAITTGSLQVTGQSSFQAVSSTNFFSTRIDTTNVSTTRLSANEIVAIVSSTFNSQVKFASSTASRCARFDANLNLVAAAGECGTTASPLTTKGDIYTFSTVDDRLPVGTDFEAVVASSSASTGLAYYPTEILLTRATSTFTLTATTTETNVLGVNIPANALGTNRMIHMKLLGDMNQNSGANQTFTLKAFFSSSTIYQDATTNIASASGRRAVEMNFWLWNNNSTSSQGFGGDVNVSVQNNATVGFGQLDSTAAAVRQTISSRTNLSTTTEVMQPFWVSLTLSTSSSQMDVIIFQAYATLL